MKTFSALAFLMLFLGCTRKTYVGNNFESRYKDMCIKSNVDAVKLGKQKMVEEFGAVINNYNPFHAHMQGDTVWIVEGTLKSEKGATPVIKLSAKDCRVVYSYFGK